MGDGGTFLARMLRNVSPIVEYAGNKASYLAFFMTNLAEALVPTAMGLVVGVFAMWCFNWRSERLAKIDSDMRIASLELVHYLQQEGRAEKR